MSTDEDPNVSCKGWPGVAVVHNMDAMSGSSTHVETVKVNVNICKAPMLDLWELHSGVADHGGYSASATP